MDKTVLFKTPHGSHLYGLAHAGSDRDYYTVLDKVKSKRAKYAKQKIVGDEDTMTLDFGTWLGQCVSGVPQACEAMFSQMAEVDHIAEFRASFCMTQDPKRKRHGLRLALNCYDFQRTGRFDPTLSPNEVDFVTEVSKKDCDVVYAYAMNMALDRLPPRMVR
jgi:hypothetical protein